MSMGGGTTVSNTQPWGPAQPYLQQGLGAAGSTFGNQGPYPQLSPTTQGAQSLIASRSLAGSPLVSTAQNTVQNIAGSDATNPYLDRMFNQASQQVSNAVNSQFTLAGSRGSPMNQDVLERNLNNLATDIYGGQYNADQNRRLAASQLAPSLANQDYNDLGQLLGVGQMQDQYNQNAYNAPWQNLGNYASVLGSLTNGLGTRNITAPSFSAVPSLLGSLLPGLNQNGQLSGALNGILGPIGNGIGSGISGLGSLLGLGGGGDGLSTINATPQIFGSGVGGGFIDPKIAAGTGNIFGDFGGGMFGGLGNGVASGLSGIGDFLGGLL